MDRIAKALERAKESRRFVPAQKAESANEAAHIEFAGAMRAEVPEDFLRKMKILTGNSSDPFSDAYKLLRTRVLQAMEAKGWVVIGVTGARPRVGKTLTSINLGIAIAKNPNYTVLLIDADLRNPSVHRLFGIEANTGLVDYLTSDSELDGFLVNPGIDRFVIFPMTSKNAGSSELLTGHKMKSLIESFRKKAGSLVVIFDLPPVLFGDDVVAMSSMLDAVLVVVEDGVTKAADLHRTVELLQGVEVLGSVLNKSKEQPHAYETYA